VRVDVAGIERIDTVGAHALLQAHRRAVEGGRELALG
jgi:anti-anti-sigma regulatory factor